MKQKNWEWKNQIGKIKLEKLNRKNQIEKIKQENNGIQKNAM